MNIYIVSRKRRHIELRAVVIASSGYLAQVTLDRHLEENNLGRYEVNQIGVAVPGSEKAVIVCDII